MANIIKQWIRKDPLQSNIFFVIVALHLTLLFFLCVDNWLNPLLMPTKNERFIVKTIELGTKPVPTSQPQASKNKEEKPIAKENQLKVEKKAENSTKKAEVKEAVEPKTQKKDTKVKAKTEKTVEPEKKIAEKKTVEKKVTSIEKKTAVSQKKSTEKKSSEAIAASTKADKAKQQAAKERQELLKQAQESINKLNKNIKNIEPSSAVIAASLPIKPMGKLQAEAASSGNSSTEEVGYVDELIGRLKILLKLPEYGNVKTMLTLNRSGDVVKVVVVSAESTTNKKYIEKTLPTLSFPAFGSNFSNEKQHTFQITLCND